MMDQEQKREWLYSRSATGDKIALKNQAHMIVTINRLLEKALLDDKTRKRKPLLERAETKKEDIPFADEISSDSHRAVILHKG